MAEVSTKESVEKLTNEIIKQIGLEAKVFVEEKEDSLKVEIEGENLGALIGYHGETLNSLQLLLSLMINRDNKDESWQRVFVDIGKWREERSGSLKEMVERALEQLSETNQEKVGLPSMNSTERREVHVLIAEQFPEFESSSEGEGSERRIFLKRK